MDTAPPNAPAELRPDDVVIDPTALPGVGGAEPEAVAPVAAPVEVPMPRDARPQPQQGPRR
jgi:hypothetical protein